MESFFGLYQPTVAPMMAVTQPSLRLPTKARVFQLLMEHCNMVGDMSLETFEDWFGDLENIVWLAPPNHID